jgi:hypothetical protein
MEIGNHNLQEELGASPQVHLEATRNRNAAVTQEVRGALARVERYLHMRNVMPIRGIDPDVIHCVHAGTEWEAEIRLSDLRLIVGAIKF